MTFSQISLGKWFSIAAIVKSESVLAFTYNVRKKCNADSFKRSFKNEKSFFLICLLSCKIHYTSKQGLQASEVFRNKPFVILKKPFE